MPRTRDGGELTRAEVARALGCSVSHVRALERRGELVPRVVAGVHLHAAADVERITLARASEPRRGARDVAGELAARAFALLATGRPAVELVTVLRLAPAAAEGLVEAFRRLRAVKLETKAKHDDAPPPDASLCASCGEACARYCAGCVKARAERSPARTASDPSA